MGYASGYVTVTFQNHDGKLREIKMAARQKLTEADHVWNRACGLEGNVWNRPRSRESNELREGDVMLGALLLVHGYIMNGGVCHAFDMTRDELAEGLKAYAYFGLHDLAEIIEPHGGRKEADYNKRYYGFFRDRNDPILDRFHQIFRDHPERFASLK